ncbi:serine hydrolase domain-containing protein [Aurantiacibacter sp. MUD61]|uniref:serine hydrolase domain-containing protein n=1 Tax=Aurantiacibacter sp. MUD61 TaxID=3009083 RepID=UPI0022F09379|nr:serine hydrolase domain-containing protein [Aurantiacibacter sp. MUD61]
MGLSAILATPAVALACTFWAVEPPSEEERRAAVPPFAIMTGDALGEDFPGDAILYREGMTYFLHWAGECDEGADWPWASVSKQVVATLVMQEVERGTLALDALAISYLPFPPAMTDDAPTIRQLLQHQSGLRNPEDSPLNANGIPEFYATGEHGLDWCLAGRDNPRTEGWEYNNCDYIVLGAVLEAVTGERFAGLLNRRFREAELRQMSLPSRRPRGGIKYYDSDFPIDISRYGPSAGLLGSVDDMIAFDRALLDGRLLSDEARETMWESDPALGYMALGQWVFELALAGCDAPVRIVERRGDIGAYEVRNFIIPERDAALAMIVHDEDFSFGETWQADSFSNSVLSAAICGDAA